MITAHQFQDSTKVIFKMSIPIFVELFLQLLVGNVDQMMISQYSQDSVAAIGNGNQIMNIVIIFMNVMGMATTVLISRYLGADDQGKVAEVCNTALAIIVSVGALLTAGTVALRYPMLQALSVPASIVEEAAMYLGIVGIFIVVQGIYGTLANILRGYSLMKEVMLVSLVMNVSNIVGNVILINGFLGFPRLGIVGAAISTDISKLLGLIIMYVLFRKQIGVKLSLSYLRPFPVGTAKELLFIGLPSGGEELSYSLSQIVILKFINLLGTAVIATKVYCSLFANVAYVYSIAIAAAAQIAIGYLVGAGRTERISPRILKTTGICIAVSLSVTALLYLNSDAIFSIFTDDPLVHQLGKQILLVEFFLEIGRSVNIVMCRCLVAIGDVIFPVVIGILSAWSISVAGGWIVGIHLGYGLVGMWIMMALDEGVRGLLFLLRLRTGIWKKKLQKMGLDKSAIDDTGESRLYLEKSEG